MAVIGEPDLAPMKSSAAFEFVPRLDEGCDGMLVVTPSGELLPAAPNGSSTEGMRKLRLPAPLRQLVRRQWSRRPEADAIFVRIGGRMILARAQARDVVPPQVLVTLLDVTRAHTRAEREERVWREQALATERRHLARELHDVVAQRLATLIVHLECDLRDHTTARERIHRYRSELKEILTAVRNVHQELRWTPAHSRSLITGIRDYAIPRLEQSRCHARVVSRGWPRSLSQDQTYHVLRLVQEATGNVARHAQASRAVIRLEGQSGCAMLSVNDNGVGFDPEARARSAADAGLARMRERAELIGGTFNLVSTPGLGTTVGLVVPIHG